jgi:ligand-binding sensor domain-containing protein/signal transduction histidine kinase
MKIQPWPSRFTGDPTSAGDSGRADVSQPAASPISQSAVLRHFHGPGRFGNLRYSRLGSLCYGRAVKCSNQPPAPRLAGVVKTPVVRTLLLGTGLILAGWISAWLASAEASAGPVSALTFSTGNGVDFRAPSHVGKEPPEKESSIAPLNVPLTTALSPSAGEREPQGHVKELSNASPVSNDTASQPKGSSLREPVHPRRNVDEFEPVMAKFVRFTILKTNRGEPCLDELEIYTAGPGARNVALASAGAVATVSGSLPGYKIHQPEHVNDGYYGNARSWISDQTGCGWVVIELPEPKRINKVVWGRDREGKFIDRLPIEYRIETALEPGVWKVVASSADRKPLTIGAEYSGWNPGTRHLASQFVPISTSLPAEPAPALAEYAVDTWQTENGLPGNTINSILQTHDGYLWLGTFGGLVRFDGIRFVVFGKAEGLRNNRIVCLCEDHEGALWIGTEGGGLVRYRSGRFETWTTRNGLPHDVVLSLAEDPAGRLWMGTMSGLVCRRGGKFYSYGSPNGLPIYRIQVDGAGRLWLLAGTELRLFDKDGFKSPDIEDEPSQFSSLLAVAAGRKGTLWIGGANAYVAKLQDGRATVFGGSAGLLSDNIWGICEARNGDVWVGTASGGLSRLRDGRFKTFTTQDGLPGNSVRAVYEDREGNIWLGFNGGGLARLKAKKLTTFTARDGLSHNVIMSLAEDQEGNLWIGSNGGGLNVRRGQKISPASPSYLLDNECIWSLHAARDGSLWIGTWGGGLYRRQGDRLVAYHEADGLADEVVLALCEDRAGGLWVGTYAGGLNYFRDGKFSTFTTSNGLSDNFVTCILEDHAGSIWVGTSGGGLNRLTEGRFQVFTRAEGLASDFVRTLYEDAEGTLWIGTGGGLSCLRHGQILSITTREGLKANVISQILEDDRDRFWFGSNQGIFRVSRAELLEVMSGTLSMVNTVSYGKAEGMESLECTGGFHPAGLKTRDGKLWFSTVQGLVMIDPKTLTSNELPPPVAIEELRVDGERIDLDGNNTEAEPGQAGRRPTGHTRRIITIPPGADHLEIRYTALSLVAPEKIRFRHRLRGLDHDWVEAGSQRVAYYTHLPVGEYQFRVAACNNDGVWNETGSVLAFKVPPPFWLTWWFSTLAAVSVLGTGGWAVRFVSVRRLERRLERLERQHALEKERARIAQDIHDDLGASLTQIGLVSELGQSHSREPNEVRTHFCTITKAAREAVQAMDAIVWAVNPRNDSLDNLANYVAEFAQDFFRFSSIRCRLDVPTDLPHLPLSSEARHNVLLAVREALNNVARHSGATEVWVRFGARNGGFNIEVEDNGRGFAQGSGGQKGDGLVNMKRRIEEMGGHFEMRTEPEQGTRLRMILELGKEARL